MPSCINRGKDAGQFWFSLFHELGHIMQEKRKQVYLTAVHKKESILLSLGRNDIEDEKNADRFAQETLIPEKVYKPFAMRHSWSEQDIQTFADAIGVDSSFVLGRLQHDKKIPYYMFNNMRKTCKL